MNNTMNIKDNNMYNGELISFGGNENNNFDLQTLINITGQNAMQLGNIGQQMGIMVSTVNNLRTGMDDLTTRMDAIEQKEEVTTTQVSELNSTAHKRVYEILGDSKDDHAKYFRTFVQRLYHGARKNAGLGSSMTRTRKGDYQRCIDYMEAWIPYDGCAGLKAEADAKAGRRKKAREQGYEV